MLALDLNDPSQVTPGTAGFVTVFVLALALIVLLRSMVGHLRKVRFQAERDAADRAGAEPVARPAASDAPAASDTPAATAEPAGGSGPGAEGSSPVSS